MTSSTESIPKTKREAEERCRKLPGMGYFQQRKGLTETESALYLRDSWFNDRGPLTAMERGLMGSAEAALVTLSMREYNAVRVYMADAMRGTCWRGDAKCRLCDSLMGYHDMITPDWKWKFPENWGHYVDGHHLKPPQDFVDDAMRWMGYEPREPLSFNCEGTKTGRISCDKPN